MLRGVRPIGNLQAVEVLDRCSTANTLVPCRPDLVARVQLVEAKLFLVACPGGRLHKVRCRLVIPLHHLKQGRRRISLMRQDKSPNTIPVRRFPVVPTFNVGRYALLSPFENDRPYLAGLALLFLDAVMNISLSFVQQQRLHLPRL